MTTGTLPHTTPNQLLDPKILSGLANLELVARAVVEGFLIGLHRSPVFGFSQEFAEYRAYSEGDDPRFVDWNVYARTNRAYIKRFLGETNSHLVLLLDASASMGYGTTAVNKLQYGKYLAASLAYLASKQHDAVGVMIFDELVRAYRPPSSRSGKLQGVFHTIDAATPASGTDLVTPFRRFREHINRRGLVAVISDFYCDVEAMIAGVRPLAFQGQDVILFHLLDAGELRPEFRNSVLLEDLESRQAIEVSPQFMNRIYPERINAHIRTLRDATAGIGADHVLVDTSQPLDQALRNYLTFRSKRR